MDYSGLQSYLKDAQQQRNPFVAPVYDEVVNDKAVFEKTITSGFGTFLTQNAGLNTVKSALKKMNIFTSEESDDLISSLGKGEGKEALQKLAKKLGKKGFKKLSKKISDQAEKFKNKGEGKSTDEAGDDAVSDVANQAGNEVETAAATATEDLAPATSTIEDDVGTIMNRVKNRASSLNDKLQDLKSKIKTSAGEEGEPAKPPSQGEPTPPQSEEPTPPQSEEPTPPSSEEPTPPSSTPAEGAEGAGDDEDLLSAGKKAVAKGLKGLIGDDAEEAGNIIGKGLKTAGEIEGLGGGPEDPITDVISAVVGLGSLIFGGLRKTHHDAFVTPPLPKQTFESSSVQQLG